VDPGESALKTRGMFVVYIFGRLLSLPFFIESVNIVERKKSQRSELPDNGKRSKKLVRLDSSNGFYGRPRLKTGWISHLYKAVAQSFCPFIRAEIDLGFPL
jgi:hypothetical protein